MTYVSGVLHFENNKHQLYSAVDTLSNLVACVSTAVELRLGRTTKWNAGDNVGFDCRRFELTVTFPLVGPVESLIRSKPFWLTRLGLFPILSIAIQLGRISKTFKAQ